MTAARCERDRQVPYKITVIRDGSTVDTLDTAKKPSSEGRIIKGMVRRKINDRYLPRSGDDPRHAGLEAINGVNLSLKRDEVVGIAGLIGRAHRTGNERVRSRLYYSRNIRGTTTPDGCFIDECVQEPSQEKIIVDHAPIRGLLVSALAQWLYAIVIWGLCFHPRLDPRDAAGAGRLRIPSFIVTLGGMLIFRATFPPMAIKGALSQKLPIFGLESPGADLMTSAPSRPTTCFR